MVLVLLACDGLGYTVYLKLNRTGIKIFFCANTPLIGILLVQLLYSNVSLLILQHN